MNIYMWFSVISLVICLTSCLFHFIRLVRLGNPKDFSRPLGEIDPAVKYAFTKAMDPRKKESAYLHLPTYTAGIIYHMGTFLSILLFFLFLFKVEPQGLLKLLLALFLAVSGLSGFSILVKRIVKKELHALTNPDDYISNLLVTIVHFLTASVLFYAPLFPVYFIVLGVLLLYLPLGKLRHTVYFFAARYQLGVFFGRRGVWPPKFD